MIPRLRRFTTRVVDTSHFASGFAGSLERPTMKLSAFDMRHPHLMFQVLDEYNLVSIWSHTLTVTLSNSVQMVEQQLLAEVAPVADSCPLDFRCV